MLQLYTFSRALPPPWMYNQIMEHEPQGHDAEARAAANAHGAAHTHSGDISDAELAALAAEAEILGDEDEKATAERLFREHLPQAVLTIAKIASGAQSERARLDAAKYIVERNLGRIQDANTINEDDPLYSLAKQLQAATTNPAPVGSN